MMAFRLRGLLPFAVIAGLSAAASAQSFQTWRVSSTPGTCGVQTTMNQQRIPTASFGFFSERRDRFQMLMSGNMSTDVPPKSGQVVFAGGRTADVREIQFVRVPSRSSLLDDSFRIILHLDTDYLPDVAQAPSFLIRFDGHDFAPFTLAERGQAVAYMASCMSKMAR